MNNQLGALTAEFGRADVAAVLASAISMVLLALPMAGLGYILLTTGRRVLRALIAVNRRRPVLRLPSVAVVLLIAAGLAFHWGLLPISRGSAALPRPAAVTVLTPAGELKTGSGLILDMGRQVRLSSVSVTFGPPPGADASIEVGNGNTLTASTLPTFTTVAGARDVGGRYTFKCTGSVQGRYVLIRFTKLPSAGSGKFRAEISNIVVRGSG